MANVILRNDSASPLELECKDIYGGNFKVMLDAGLSQNQNLMEGSEILLNGENIHFVLGEDEGKEIVVAR